MKSSRPEDSLRCSFCGKSQGAANRLISPPNGDPRSRAYICDECIRVCDSILTDDEQEKWPAHLDVGFYPTPIDEMPRLSEALGGPRLFIKRDDYTGPGFGGNKVRKLEFVLADAQKEGADVVLTMGGIKSNHARVTAALAAQAGFECHLILNGDGSGMPASLYLDELFGAKIHRVANRQDREPAMKKVAGELRGAGRKPYEIPLGASTPLGALGYVRAAAEIAGAGMRFAAIFHSTSSGGTQAGLVAGVDMRVIGVSADDPAERIAARVENIAKSAAELVGKSTIGTVEVDDRFVGPGYGISTPESDEAIRLFARYEGIVLDPVYTAKAAAAMIARIRAGEFKRSDTVLFIHTGGQLALFNVA